MSASQIEVVQYDLSKKISDMKQRTFTIQTAYGEIEISPFEEGGKNVVHAVERMLLKKLAKAKKDCSSSLAVTYRAGGL